MQSGVRTIEVAGEGLLPLAIAGWASESGHAIAVFVASDDAILKGLLDALPAFLPDRCILALPAGDSLPYDRARPSRRSTGTRVASLTWLADGHDKPAIVLTTPEALSQRVPPAERLRERSVYLATGDQLDSEWLRATLEAFGYVFEERVDGPGEAALRPGAVDIFPAGQTDPVRLELDDGRIIAIRPFDPQSQRGTGEAASLRLLPASEAFTVPGEVDTGESLTTAERLLPDGPLSRLFDLIPDAAFGLMQDTEERIADWLALTRDGYAAALNAVRAGHPAPPVPDELFLPEAEVVDELARRDPVRFIVDAEPAGSALPPAPAVRQAASFLEKGEAVIFCTDGSPQGLKSFVARRLHMSDDEVSILAAWHDAEALPAGQIGVMHIPLRAGFHLPDRTIIAVRTSGRQNATSVASLQQFAGALRVGDMVVDPERGSRPAGWIGY